MKNVFKWLGIVLLVAAVVFSMGACSNGTTGGGDGDGSGGGGGGGGGGDGDALVGAWIGTGEVAGTTLGIGMAEGQWAISGIITESGTYTVSGGVATLKVDTLVIGTAKLDGDNLKLSLNEDSGMEGEYTFTKVDEGGEGGGGGGDASAILGTWFGKAGTTAEGLTCTVTETSWSMSPTGETGTYTIVATSPVVMVDFYEDGAKTGQAYLEDGVFYSMMIDPPWMGEFTK